MKLILNNTGDYNEIFQVYEAEILQVTVNKIEVLGCFLTILAKRAENS